MEKTKAVLKIESFTDGFLVLSVPSEGVKTLVKHLVDLCKEKYSGYIKVDMSPPYKPKTNHVGGQNRHIWGHIQQIATETGNEIETVEDAAKERAIARGYPYDFNPITGKPKPASIADLDTREAGILIETLHQLAAELEITLEEE